MEQLETLLQFFSYQHLPEALQTVSKPFCELANRIVKTLPRNPERTTALRKLLEAKDCAVRALIWVMPYKSEAQRRKFHVLEKEGKISPSTVKEFDEASKGKKLPEKVDKPKGWTHPKK